jgi:membrane protein implicated in regulation of membrane protease activity
MRKEPEAKRRPSSHRGHWRYLLLQIPELALVMVVLTLAYEWEWLSRTSLALVFAAWIVKEIAMFFLVRKALAPREGGSTHDPLGEVGIAHEGLDDEAYVRLGHELWRARRAPGASAIPPGEAVRVVGLEGLTVLVEGCGMRTED